MGRGNVHDLPWRPGRAAKSVRLYGIPSTRARTRTHLSITQPALAISTISAISQTRLRIFLFCRACFFPGLGPINLISRISRLSPLPFESPIAHLALRALARTRSSGPPPLHSHVPLSVSTVISTISLWDSRGSEPVRISELHEPQRKFNFCRRCENYHNDGYASFDTARSKAFAPSAMNQHMEMTYLVDRQDCSGSSRKRPTCIVQYDILNHTSETP